MDKQVRVGSDDPCQKPDRFAATVTQPLVFPHGPADQVFVDLPEHGADQPRAVEAPVIVDPPAHDRVDKGGDIPQILTGPQVQPPPSDLLPFGLGRRVTDRGQERDEVLPSLLLAFRARNV